MLFKRVIPCFSFIFPFVFRIERYADNTKVIEKFGRLSKCMKEHLPDYDEKKHCLQEFKDFLKWSFMWCGFM